MLHEQITLSRGCRLNKHGVHYKWYDQQFILSKECDKEWTQMEDV